MDLLSELPVSTDAHPIPAPNPTPGVHTHPSYAEMIAAAILWDSSQGKVGGSSKRAIAKYIDRVYTNLPPTHSSLLTHHLKRLQSSGQLVMFKSSYMLPFAPGSAPPPPPPPPPQLPQPPQQPPLPASFNPSPKRGPGRPPKPKPAQAQAQTQPIIPSQSDASAPSSALHNGGSSVAAAAKRPRGRPPKQHQPPPLPPVVVAEVPFAQPQPVFPGLIDGGGQILQERRRPGRPPKQPVAQPVSGGPVNGLPKRRPGRPAKSNVGVGLAGSGQGKPRGRPRKSGLGLGPVSGPVGKRPRGRPPKHGGAAATAAAVGGGAAAVVGKRRGRPPKSGGQLMPTRSTGRVGRPRKNTSSTTMHATEQGQGMANEVLLRNLEHIQLKIRDAVGVLRPHVGYENAPDALTALNQLEELATMNITARTTVTPPTMTAMPTSFVGPPPTRSVPPVNVADAPPTLTVNPPTMVAPSEPFNVNMPTMTVNVPFHVPSSVESQQPPFSWISSSEPH